jgi:hypothetical protein
MKNDLNVSEVLDGLLADWHLHCRSEGCERPLKSSAMWANAKSSRGWDSTEDIVDGELSASTMKTISFEVGEMAEPGRSAIYAHARNLTSRAAVWASPRLPACAMERAELLGRAKEVLVDRLVRAGVM